MNIFDKTFLDRIFSSVYDAVAKAIETFSKNQVLEQRYLKNNQARKYLGGIDYKTLSAYEGAGLPKIIVNTANGESVRYDKKDIDDFMAKHKN